MFDASSSTVTSGWACGEGLMGLEALGRSSSVIVEVRAVEIAESCEDESSVLPADEAERCVLVWSSADVESEFSDAVREKLARASPSAPSLGPWLLTASFPRRSVLIASSFPSSCSGRRRPTIFCKIPLETGRMVRGACLGDSGECRAGVHRACRRALRPSYRVQRVAAS